MPAVTLNARGNDGEQEDYAETVDSDGNVLVVVMVLVMGMLAIPLVAILFCVLSFMMVRSTPTREP